MIGFHFDSRPNEAKAEIMANVPTLDELFRNMLKLFIEMSERGELIVEMKDSNDSETTWMLRAVDGKIAYRPCVTILTEAVEPADAE